MSTHKDVLAMHDAGHLAYEEGQFFCPDCNRVRNFVAKETDAGIWFVGCQICDSEPAVCGEYANGHFCRNYAEWRTKADKEYYCGLHLPNDLADDEIEFLEGLE